MPSDYQESKDRYLKEKVEEFKIRVPKGQKAVIQAYAKEQGKSLNSYVVGLIDEDMNTTKLKSTSISKYSEQNVKLVADSTESTHINARKKKPRMTE